MMVIKVVYCYQLSHFRYFIIFEFKYQWKKHISIDLYDLIWSNFLSYFCNYLYIPLSLKCLSNRHKYWIVDCFPYQLLQIMDSGLSPSPIEWDLSFPFFFCMGEVMDRLLFWFLPPIHLLQRFIFLLSLYHWHAIHIVNILEEEVHMISANATTEFVILINRKNKNNNNICITISKAEDDIGLLVEWKQHLGQT